MTDQVRLLDECAAIINACATMTAPPSGPAPSGSRHSTRV